MGATLGMRWQAGRRGKIGSFLRSGQFRYKVNIRFILENDLWYSFKHLKANHPWKALKTLVWGMEIGIWVV
jgi:hypothetical protein